MQLVHAINRCGDCIMKALLHYVAQRSGALIMSPQKLINAMKHLKNLGLL